LINFEGTLRAAKKGNEDAFASIWREFHPGLLRYLKVKAASDAEDLAADIWHRIIRALPTFEGDEDGFRGWLFTSARNRLTDWYRRSASRPESIEYAKLMELPASNSVEAEAEENSSTDLAIAMIGQLPPDQAEAVMLRIVAGLDVGSVAKIMRRSPGSVRVLSHRGLRRLEVALNSPSTPDHDLTELTGAACAVGAAPGASTEIEGGRRHG
jgi:RNA polymerase sigma-70 factor (ECF subfamily)